MRVRPPASPSVRRCAATCRAAVPTVTLPPPAWFEAEASPWSCVRDSAPRALTTTERCADCLRWLPRPAPPRR